MHEDQLLDRFPATCGEKAYQAIQPTNQLIGLFRDKGLSNLFLLRILNSPKKMETRRYAPEKAKAEDYQIFPEIDFRPIDNP